MESSNDTPELIDVQTEDVSASDISDIASNSDKHQEETKSRVPNSSPTTSPICTKPRRRFLRFTRKRKVSNIMRERNREKEILRESAENQTLVDKILPTFHVIKKP